MRRIIFHAGLAAVLGGLCAGPPVAAQTRPAAAATASAVITACPAYITVEGKQVKVTLVDCVEDKLYFIMGDSPVGNRLELECGKVESTFFELKYDYAALNTALATRNWAAAARALTPTLTPTLPFLNLRDNNAVEKVLDLGNYMYSAAEATADAARTEEEEAQAREQFKAAFRVYNAAGKAEWSSVGMVGRIKSYRCLVALDKAKTARALLEKLPTPMPGDRAYGLYWLLMGFLDFADGHHRAAMQDAVNSLCFENKDVDTFPDALLLSAQCYEELQEWHRARDVYYEVARLFPNTDWQDGAVRRLHFIMDRGLTKKKEEALVESVFFGVQEDMNKKVEELFNALAAGPKSLFAAQEDNSPDVDEEEDNLNLDEPDT